MSTMPFGDFLSGFSNLLGGTASLPYLKSTSENLPFQDALFNAFQNRQSIFAPTVAASGSPDARGSTPFFNELSGGGLQWSYDPNWLTGLPHPAAKQEQFFPTPEPTGGGGGGRGPADVHGGPVDILRFDPTPPQKTPMPAPLDPYGSWVWQWDSENPGQGQWIWTAGNRTGGGREHERIQY